MTGRRTSASLSPAAPLIGRASFGIAVALIMAANVLLPLQDALSKSFIEHMPVAQVLLVRSFTVMVLALALGRTRVVSRIIHSPVKRTILKTAVGIGKSHREQSLRQRSVRGSDRNVQPFKRLLYNELA